METLTAEQKKAVSVVRKFLNNPSAREMVFMGAAGTGKTYALRYALKDVDQMTTVAGTVSHAASTVLRESIGDISDCHTLAKLQGKTPKTEKGKTVFVRIPGRVKFPIQSASLVIIDECSMIDHKDREELLKESPANCKFIYVGDKYQLPPVESDDMSPTFGVPISAELVKPVRYTGVIAEIAQFYRDYIEYASAVPQNQIDLSNLFRYTPTLITPSSKVFFTRNNAEFLNYAIDDFSKDPYSTRILAYKNSVIDYINGYMRDLFYHGQAEYVPGEQIIMVRPFGKTHNGEIYIIDKVEDTYIVTDLGFSKHYGNDEEESAWKKPKYKYKAFNLVLKDKKGARQMIQVPHSDSARSIEKFKVFLRDKAKNDKRYWSAVNILDDSFAHIARTYATTTHKAQGQSINSVFVMANDIFSTEKTTTMTKLRSLYVAASRAKQNLYILLP